VAGLAREAAERGAKLIVLPEATVPGYVLGTEPVSEAQLERAREDLRATAARNGAAIVYGTAKLDRGRVYNAAVCIGPDGAEIGYAAKQFLWHFDRRWFAAGDRLQPLATPFGTLGLLVCADGRIPTIAATLVERGAQILVMPTAWVTSGRDPAALENVQADLMAGVRARENGVPFVVANKCGVELESVAYCGKSAILDANGDFVARGSERAEEIVYGEVELPAAAPQPRLAQAFALPAGAASPARGEGRRERARVAFTTAREARDLERFGALAAFADCDVLFARDVADARTHPPLARANAPDAGTLGTCDGLTYAVVDDATMQNPRGLVEARLAEIDFIVWRSAPGGDRAWRTRFARTRAAELRAYVLVLEAEGERAFAVDPDGAVIAGTFDDYRLASFAYERARTRATTVAPTTDVLEGLRIAEAIRERHLSGVR
jgi:predicted amidohydrolase